MIAELGLSCRERRGNGLGSRVCPAVQWKKYSVGGNAMSMKVECFGASSDAYRYANDALLQASRAECANVKLWYLSS